MKIISKLISIILVIVVGSQIASASLWIGDKEIGLSQYQSNGYVGNNKVVRLEFSNIQNIYIESSKVSIMYSIDGYRKITVNGNTFYIYNENINFDIGD